MARACVATAMARSSTARAQVSLTSSLGTLTLGPSASIDLRAGTEAAGNDGRARARWT